MTPPIPDLLPPTSVEGQATTWFARRRSGEMTVAEATDLEAWLEADPHHRLAFEAVEAIWSGFGNAREAPEILAMRAAARRRPASAVYRAFAVRAAAVLVAAVLAGFGLWSVEGFGLFGGKDLPDQTFKTELGQRSTVTLPDGSIVTLNTDTVLRTQASPAARLVFLEKGQAYFRVAPDRTHPFIVHAGGRTITAIGTAFDVRVEKGRFEVTLVEGKVKVETPIAPSARSASAAPAPAIQMTELVPGTQFVVGEDDRWGVTQADPVQETAWVTGWLAFDREPLAAVLTELSRYSDRRLALADPSLADLPISGRFRAGDIDGFVQAVAVYDIAPADPSATTLSLARRSQ